MMKADYFVSMCDESKEKTSEELVAEVVRARPKWFDGQQPLFIRVIDDIMVVVSILPFTEEDFYNQVTTDLGE